MLRNSFSCVGEVEKYLLPHTESKHKSIVCDLIMSLIFVQRCWKSSFASTISNHFRTFPAKDFVFDSLQQSNFIGLLAEARL